MGLIVAATAGLCLWIIFWSGELGAIWSDLKLGGFDGMLVAAGIVLVAIMVRNLIPHLPGRRK